MAKEQVTSFELNQIEASTTAQNVIEKKYLGLNGFDAALRKNAQLLIFSTSMKEEKRERNGIKYKTEFFWALDIERNKLVKVSRSGLSGGMGYESLPEPGEWSLNEDKTWYVLKPNENDPAIQSRKSWGVGRLLPGAFDYEHEKISVPRCFIIEVNDVIYLCNRNPVDASSTEAYIAKELQDTTFKPDNARMWDGKAYYPTRDFLKELVDKYNSVHSDGFTEDTIGQWLK